MHFCHNNACILVIAIIFSLGYKNNTKRFKHLNAFAVWSSVPRNMIYLSGRALNIGQIFDERERKKEKKRKDTKKENEQMNRSEGLTQCV